MMYCFIDSVSNIFDEHIAAPKQLYAFNLQMSYYENTPIQI